jgi:hypothetical protein
MRASKEYQLYKNVAAYLRLQYPRVMYHFDLTGVNLSKAQAGMTKAIQHCSGYPDLFIAEPRKGSHGLYLELKAEGTRLFKRNCDLASDHLKQQASVLSDLRSKGYDAWFAVGFEEAKELIDKYLS